MAHFTFKSGIYEIKCGIFNQSCNESDTCEEFALDMILLACCSVIIFSWSNNSYKNSHSSKILQNMLKEGKHILVSKFIEDLQNW